MKTWIDYQVRNNEMGINKKISTKFRMRQPPIKPVREDVGYRQIPIEVQSFKFAYDQISKYDVDWNEVYIVGNCDRYYSDDFDVSICLSFCAQESEESFKSRTLQYEVELKDYEQWCSDNEENILKHEIDKANKKKAIQASREQQKKQNDIDELNKLQLQLDEIKKRLGTYDICEL